jgi:hypothetical protein
MAVAVQMLFPGGTLEQYDQVIRKMGFRAGGPGGPGGLFHWVTKTDKGVLITDVWENREAFEKFSREQIRPISAEVGVPEPSEVSFFDVHNYLTKG